MAQNGQLPLVYESEFNLSVANFKFATIFFGTSLDKYTVRFEDGDQAEFYDIQLVGAALSERTGRNGMSKEKGVKASASDPE